MCPVYLDPRSAIEVKLNRIEDYLELKDIKHTIYQELAWKSINDMLKQYTIYNLEDIYLEVLVKLSIKLAGIYYSQIRLRDGYFRKRKQLKNSRDTIALYQEIISIIFTNNRTLDYDAIIEAFQHDQLCVYERFCTKLTEIYIDISQRNEHVISKILENVEDYITEQATYPKVKSLLNILTDISHVDNLWPKYEVDLIIRLLNVHIRSIEAHNPIRHGIEVCIRKVLSISVNDMLLFIIDYILETYAETDLPVIDLKKIEFSIQIATILYISDDSLLTSFKYDTLRNILTLITSDSIPKCIFGNETFQNILGTSDNLSLFRAPRIFFMKIDYKLNIKKLQGSNLEFIRRYRKELHLTFLTAIIKHRDDLRIIHTIYTSIALIMTEIPCEYTAAMLVCLIMNIQKYTLAHTSISCEASHRIHAVVIAIMSLICWTTEAKMLYLYLDKILKLRAYTAPFLNPPLKAKYVYATHFVLWNKPELFFENFEVRYALWKRFRLNEKFADRPPLVERKKTKKQKKEEKRKKKAEKEKQEKRKHEKKVELKRQAERKKREEKRKKENI